MRQVRRQEIGRHIILMKIQGKLTSQEKMKVYVVFSGTFSAKLDRKMVRKCRNYKGRFDIDLKKIMNK